MRADWQRPRERLLIEGAERCSTDELLALVIGAGIRGSPALSVARSLLEEVGGLAALSRADAIELCAVPGVGAARAARVSAAFQLGRRSFELGAAERDTVGSAEEVFNRLRARMIGLSQEVFVVLALDVKNNLIGQIEVARGWLAGVEVHPREVFRPLIARAAAAAVLVHNHPSGDPAPSDEDLLLTQRLVKVGALVGIPILDHVVIAGGEFASIRELLGDMGQSDQA